VLRHARTHLDDLADELVAEHVALAQERDVSAEQVQVRTAGDGAPDPHDDVATVPEFRVRDGLDG
jgi:hypothetical protein